MESNIQSSFIPSDTVQRGRNFSSRREGTDLFVLIAVVLFIASLALGVGVFLYEQFLKTSNASKVEQLERARAAFEPSLIRELTRLDDRMESGELILNKHLAPSAFFRLLESITLQTVSYRNLSFNAADKNQMTLEMSGFAQSVNSIALQADLFGKSGAVSSPIFSNITRETGGVRFDMSAIINPSAINYVQKNAASAAAAIPQQSLQTQTTPQATTTDTDASPFAPQQ